MTKPRSPHLLLLAAGIFAAFPLWCARYLPFTDLAEHEAVSAALVHRSDAAWKIDEYYTFAFDKTPYWLYDAIGAVLTRVFGDAILAHRILLTVVCVGLPFAVAAFLGALGRERALGACAAPFFWSRPLQFGFVPFIAAIPLFFFGLACGARLVRKPTVGLALGTLSIALVLSLLHTMVYGLFLFTYVGWVVLARLRRDLPRPRRPSALVWVPFTSLALALPYVRIASRGGEGGAAFAAPWVTAYQLPSWTFDLWKGPWDDAAAALYWIAIFILFRSGYAAAGLRIKGRAIFLAWPLIAVLAVMLALPLRYDSVYMVNKRLAPIMVCAFLALLHRSRTREAKVGAVLIGVASVLTTLVAFREVKAGEAELRGFDRITRSIPFGSRTFIMNYDLESRLTHFPPWVHLGSAIVAQRGGLAQYSFASLSHWPMQDKASPRKRHAFWFNMPCYFDARDSAFYDSILVYGNYLPLPSPETEGYKIVASAPPFYLWRRLPPDVAPLMETPTLPPPPCKEWGDPSR